MRYENGHHLDASTTMSRHAIPHQLMLKRSTRGNRHVTRFRYMCRATLHTSNQDAMRCCARRRASQLACRSGRSISMFSQRSASERATCIRNREMQQRSHWPILLHQHHRERPTPPLPPYHKTLATHRQKHKQAKTEEKTRARCLACILETLSVLSVCVFCSLCASCRLVLQAGCLRVFRIPRSSFAVC